MNNYIKVSMAGVLPLRCLRSDKIEKKEKRIKSYLLRASFRTGTYSQSLSNSKRTLRAVASAILASKPAFPVKIFALWRPLGASACSARLGSLRSRTPKTRPSLSRSPSPLTAESPPRLSTQRPRQNACSCSPANSAPRGYK